MWSLVGRDGGLGHVSELLSDRSTGGVVVAARLVVSVRTVDSHLQRTYRKLGISLGSSPLFGSRRGASAAT